MKKTDKEIRGNEKTVGRRQTDCVLLEAWERTIYFK